MGLADILILTILIMGFILGFGGFYTALYSNPDYNQTNISNFSSFNKIMNLTAKVNNISQTFQNASNVTNPNIGTYIFYAPYQYIKGGTEAGLLIFDMSDMIGTIATDIAMAYGSFIPSWVMSTIYFIILVTVIFAIIFFILGKR